jgi:hypothetical protein
MSRHPPRPHPASAQRHPPPTYRGHALTARTDCPDGGSAHGARVFRSVRVLFVSGIDPHRGSRTAAVLNGAEELVDEYRVVADRRQRQRLLEWAAPFTPRVWAVEGATGTGVLLHPTARRGRRGSTRCAADAVGPCAVLDSGRSDKTDSHDPRAAVVVALRHRSLRSVRAEDHVTMLRRSLRAREENRTPDLRITSALLCRLSYSGGKGRG